MKIKFIIFRTFLSAAIILSFSFCLLTVSIAKSDVTLTQQLPYKVTLAIMPMENLTKNPELDWLSAGIPESLISKLQNVRLLRMVERIRIKDVLKEISLGQTGLVSADTAKEAGKMLGADTVLSGSFAEFHGSLQIQARMVNVASAQIIGAVEANGRLNRIFQLQDRLAEKIIHRLGIDTEEDEKARLQQVSTRSMEAYEYYVRGRDYYFEHNREGYEKAVELYREAIEQDTTFALAYAGIASSLATLAYSRKKEGESYRSLFKEGRQAAQTAIELNPNSSDTHRSLAHVYLNQRKFSDARREITKALGINPNDAESWYILAQTATAIPDLDKAQRYYENAIRLNPDYAMAHNNLGWYVFLKKKWYDKAIASFERAIQISPDFTEAYDSLGEAYFRLGNYEKACRNFKKALELQPNHKNAARQYKRCLKKLK
ncbi:tetratricopeptide repeat protein [Thermodesulfobacteriota bacterium]